MTVIMSLSRSNTLKRHKIMPAISQHILFPGRAEVCQGLDDPDKSREKVLWSEFFRLDSVHRVWKKDDG